ncbi:MAG: hypothetical protein Q9196_004494 [Gyalolechia fulgens]
MSADAPPTGSGTSAAKKIESSDSWYYPDIEVLPDATRELFERYSAVPAEEVIDHIQKMRSRAFEIYPYPCIGQLRFLNLSLSRHPLYPEVLERLRPRRSAEGQQHGSLSISGQSSGITYHHARPQVLLDLGCCLAQDLRKLVLDGVPSENLYGLDMEKDFIDLSYDLFHDRATLKSQFIIEDLLRTDRQGDPPDRAGDGPPGTALAWSTPAGIPLASLYNRVSIIVANSFFHNYNYSDQLRLAKRVMQLLSPEPGSLVLGRQVGSTQPGEYNALDNKGTRYSHDVDSFRSFWDQVAEEIGNGCKFRVEAVLDEEEFVETKNQGQIWSEPNIRRLRYGVWRV